MSARARDGQNDIFDNDPELLGDDTGTPYAPADPATAVAMGEAEAWDSQESEDAYVEPNSPEALAQEAGQEPPEYPILD